jgi:DNA-binding SARP family transcriptional activator
MARQMEFGLLGPLLVRRDGVQLPVSPGNQRVLLAALLLRAGAIVQSDELATVLWGAAIPASAPAALHNTVMRLRRALGDSSRTMIIAHAGGYELDAAAGELDIVTFEALIESAKRDRQAGNYLEAAGRLQRALSLWRGHPLADICSDALVLGEVARLEELRLRALDWRIDADLRLGRHAEVIPELRRLAAATPLRERFHALLMLALHRDGQQAAALAAFHDARAVLTRELGCEPGPELRDLQQQILTGSGGFNGGDPVQTVPAAVPRQLPFARPDFTGRRAELAALEGMTVVPEQGREPGPGHRAPSAQGMVPIVITGTAGVGKTALAVHWAHGAANRYPDGQLYLDLRGHSPSGPPLQPADALRLLLDGLGLAAERIPAAPDAQAALYRTMLAGRRMLIVLDNVRDPAQVRPLLPGGGRCLVLITSRNQLTGLTAAHSAALVRLDVLSATESRELLGQRIGKRRTAAEREATAELAELCSRLPLALCIAAAQLAARPALTVSALTAELRDLRSRLDQLTTDDPGTDARTVLSWSYSQLSPRAARMLRLLGVHPGPDISIPGAASLAGWPVPQARRALAELAAAHLVTERAAGRFDSHDLLRAYAAERARISDSAADRRDALIRVLDYYLHAGFAASIAVQPDRQRIPLGMLLPGVVAEQPGTRPEALAWLRAERRAIALAASAAAVAGLTAYAWQLPWVTALFLRRHGYWHELAETQRIAIGALTADDGRAFCIGARRVLALAELRLGNPDAASACLRDALEIARLAGLTETEVRVRVDLAEVRRAAGDEQGSLAQARHALELARTIGPAETARGLANLGWLEAFHGRHELALQLCTAALSSGFADADERARACVMDSLGYACHQAGRYSEAVDWFSRAVGGLGENDDPQMRADVLTHLGDSHAAAGNASGARAAWRAAITLLNQLGDPQAEVLRARVAWIGRGRVRESTSD